MRDSKKLVLLALNGFLLLVIVFEMIISFRSRNKCLSWFNAFHFLCLAWTILRLTFWVFCLIPWRWTHMEFYCLYWLPSPIQFANFSLLALFYSQVLLGGRRSRTWWYAAATLYVLATLAMFCFTILWAVISSDAIDDTWNWKSLAEQLDSYNYVSIVNMQVQRISTAVAFLVLSVMFAYSGYRVSQLKTIQHRQGMVHVNKKTLATVNCLPK